MNLGTGEIIFIAILLLVLYGKRLPEITRAIGKGLAEVKRSLEEVKQNIMCEDPAGTSTEKSTSGKQSESEETAVRDDSKEKTLSDAEDPLRLPAPPLRKRGENGNEASEAEGNVSKGDPYSEGKDLAG